MTLKRAGIEIQVVRRTVFTEPAISTGTYVYPPLVQFIDALGWVSGVLLVRVYATTHDRDERRTSGWERSIR